MLKKETKERKMFMILLLQNESFSKFGCTIENMLCTKYEKNLLKFWQLFVYEPKTSRNILDVDNFRKA